MDESRTTNREPRKCVSLVRRFMRFRLDSDGGNWYHIGVSLKGACALGKNTG